jgi:hypothetical protein
MADGPKILPEHPVPLRAPSTRVDGPRRTGGWSSRSGQTVRLDRLDGLSPPFSFSLRYSEIKI